MTEQDTQLKNPHWRLRGPSWWSVAALLIALVVVAPIASLVWMAFNPAENIWPHLWSTTLPRYLGNTLVLALAVATLAAAIGTGAAWITVMYSFPGARLLQWFLLLPLAIPAYVGAYALVDFLEYAGPVQSGLRALFGWKNARAYWFPEIRSMGAAIVVLSAALYPYVFLMARAAFREQSGCTFEVAQALGAGPFARLFRVGLPLARPAIAAGVAVVMMETVSDFGVVDYFAVQTLTTGIFTTWLEMNNAGGAAQIAMVVLVLVFVLVALEKVSRSKSRFYRLSRQHRPVEPVRLRGLAGWAAALACTIPFLVGFALPVGVIGAHALENGAQWLAPGLLLALWHTLSIGALAAGITVGAALVMVYGVRLSAARLPRLLLPISTIGYAAPGAVLGVGILIPLARIDNTLADAIQRLTGHDPGLLLTGTAFAVVLAYIVRFFAIAQGATDAAMGRVSPSLPMAARSLGRSASGALREVYVPMIKGSVGTALLLVFVDSVKELPATLLLRPFNYNTLSTRVYEQASLEQIGAAAPAALLVIGVGLAAVALMARSSR